MRGGVPVLPRPKDCLAPGAPGLCVPGREQSKNKIANLKIQLNFCALKIQNILMLYYINRLVNKI